MMSITFGTSDGVWQLDGTTTKRIGMEGMVVSHVANRKGTTLAAVPRDGLYMLSEDGERCVWEGDARASAIGPDGKFYVGTEPAMVFRSDDVGKTWKRLDQMDDLPTRSEWSFPPAPHEAHVRSIDFLPDSEGSVLVGIEVGGVLLSDDHGDNWREMNDGVYVDVHAVRPDPSHPGRLVAVTGRGLYVTEDNGESWEHITEGLGQGYAVGVHINPSRAGEVLIATGQAPPGVNGQVYHSLNGGHSWERIQDPILPEHYDVVPVVLFTEDGAWIATDKGQIFHADDPRGGWTLTSEVPTPVHSASAGGSPSSISSGFR
ncbi:MAG: hypothetical protein IIC27_05285 [Chloroflexi bacterium]|nr:hypothetical protein [Chloroflexota bacterium]